MSTQPTQDVRSAFLLQSRKYFSHDYVPKIERCLEAVTDQDVWWRPNEDSNSIGNLLLHLSGNVRQWIVSGLGGAADHRQRQTEFDERSVISKQQLLNRLKETVAEVDAVLEQFDPGNLLAPYRIQNCDVSALEAIYHVVEHFSMHTGQIITLTKLLTKKDLNFYDFPDGVPVYAWLKEEGQSE
ncbi:MAG TPA: DinB family protein [Pyrinomonadaceae bacterium]|jgi:uncharacterized damage-inducible protein DinB|nr:DinB family protein [Pyrinomonadaceae bacterium]